MGWHLIALVILCCMFQSPSFKQTQLANSRVKNAYAEKELLVKQYFQQKGFAYQGFHLFIQIFKNEQQVEVWVKKNDGSTYSLLHTYEICAPSGIPGPKRKEGDLQVPEGVYKIQHFNPLSNFHLSLGINYPNASDKILSDQKHPGGQIYVHGNCVTVGCVPITDDKIKELYILAVEARNNGQSDIPVYIFPAKLEPDTMESLAKQYVASKSTVDFWRNLQTIYLDFNRTKSLQKVKVNKEGQYFF